MAPLSYTPFETMLSPATDGFLHTSNSWATTMK